MKNRPLIGAIGALIVLFATTSFGQTPGRSATGKLGLGQMLKQKQQETTVQVDAVFPTASQVLANILGETNTTPLSLYPSGYLKQLAAAGNQPMFAQEQFSPNAYALKAGDKANMSWCDAMAVMGSPTSEAERNSDEVQHTAIISYGFYIGNYEVTQNEYQQIMGSNPSWFTSAHGYTDDLNRPVENVTWAQANAFCVALTSQAQADGSIQAGWAYRLPTEAEWEYSCRAGSKATVFDIEGPQSVGNVVSQYYFVYPVTALASGGSQVSFSVHNNSPTTQLFTYEAADIGLTHAYQVGSHQFNGSGKITGSDTVSGTFWGDIVSGTSYRVGFTYQTAGNDPGIALENGDYIRVTTPDPGAFSFGNSIRGGYANFDDHYEYDVATGTINITSPTVPFLNMTTVVGSYNANGFGLYDMHGNVAEWCQDWYGAYPTTTTVDPQGPTSGSTTRVVRGGSWADAGTLCRSAIRSGVNPSTASSHIGFRIVLAPVTPEWKTAVETTPTAKTYGNPPTKSADGLVLITHGWTWLFPDQSWIDRMSNSFTAHIGSGWQVYGYYWMPNSATPFSPDKALVNATQEGIKLGNSIVDQGWTKVHFIAHSAGAQLIQVATEIIKGRSPSTVVQCTFLDPYDGTDFVGQATYGNGADWSDRYSAHGDVVNAVSPYTEIPLNSAYNVDVTGLDPSFANSTIFLGQGLDSCSFHQSSHSWPIGFYQNSITNTPPGYEGFGFPLSIEAGGLQNAITTYPVGNIASVRILGTQPAACNGIYTTYGATPVIHVDFFASPKASQSTSGTVTPSTSTLTLITGSPAWLSLVPTNTLPVNLLSFSANFTSSGIGAAGLLSVYWDSNVIATVDERVVGQGAAQYSVRFPVTESNSTHVLSFRLDPFTNVQSTVVITNAVLSQVGVTQPFSLSATTNTVNGLRVYQLSGQTGFDYGLQASTNLVDWTQIAVLENTNGTVMFYDQSSTNYPCRFYRAVAPY